MSKNMVGLGASNRFSGVAMKLLNRCGMISGAGSPDTVTTGLAVRVPLAPEATCLRVLDFKAGLASTQGVPPDSANCVNPFSERRRMYELFESDLSGSSAPAGLSRVSRADVEAALAKAGAGLKELNLFEFFNV
jgi:hypothetical protein